MLQSRVCPRCELRSLFTSWQPQRQQIRGAARAVRQRDAPSRMKLSPSVAKPKRGAPIKATFNGPFGGMNRVDPGIRVRAEKSRQDARAQRAQEKKTGRHMPKKAEPRQMKALKMQSALGRVSYGARAEIKQRIDQIDSFDDFPLLPSVVDSIYKGALNGLVDIKPTPIQRLAVPALLGYGDRPGRHQDSPKSKSRKAQFLLAAETGSGKTLAYTIPVVDALKRQEAEEAEEEAEQKGKEDESKRLSLFELEPPPLSNEVDPSTGRPRCIVLVPTAELVEQVGRLFKTFSHSAKLRVSLISTAYTATVIRNRLFKQPIDVVISTPHLLNSIADSDPRILSRVTHLVIDEADSLFDRSFGPITTPIIDRATPSMKQLILCSATIPKSLDTYLRNRFPEIERLATPNLHAIPRRVQLSVVDIDKEPYRGNRDLACADTIWNIGRDVSTAATELGSDGQPVKNIIVFVNEREEAERVATYLTSKGVDAAPMTRDTADRKGGEAFSAFTGIAASSSSSATPSRSTAARMLPNTKVLVMTDLGSRGIDTTAVRHVVLYDVPHTSVDFIHRLGRTGRMGRRGRGVVLAGKSDRKDVIADVRESMFRGQALI